MLTKILKDQVVPLRKKYELLDQVILLQNGIILYRIRALRALHTVEIGDLGGYVQSEDNLSHHGNCWISDKAYVVNGARIINDAEIGDRSVVGGDAEIGGRVWIAGTARLVENQLFRHSEVIMKPLTWY